MQYTPHTHTHTQPYYRLHMHRRNHTIIFAEEHLVMRCYIQHTRTQTHYIHTCRRNHTSWLVLQLMYFMAHKSVNIHVWTLSWGNFLSVALWMTNCNMIWWQGATTEAKWIHCVDDVMCWTNDLYMFICCHISMDEMYFYGINYLTLGKQFSFILFLTDTTRFFF